ncbi:MAG: tRNA (adenosine(37)-N6)-threonylcarbamoyltransferase complex dimerization subunit type 1 TsaB [Candidatus Peregrinibacteria bacterium]|nr:tRNA (adenosine(37)-N6)-threonylcarbamoyltransferase complex dimerization subunit type 1 TsaB [Candidatus Peregrinibacteria bacterium]
MLGRIINPITDYNHLDLLRDCLIPQTVQAKLEDRGSLVGGDDDGEGGHDGSVARSWAAALIPRPFSRTREKGAIQQNNKQFPLPRPGEGEGLPVRSPAHGAEAGEGTSSIHFLAGEELGVRAPVQYPIPVPTLFLDLASHSGLVACTKDEEIVSSKAVDHRIADHELTPIIEEMLKKAGWKFEDLTQLACVSGPGGFTSLRVAVSTINTMSYLLNIPSAGIHLSDLYRARVTEENFLWLHSTKKTEIFARGFGEYTKDFPEAVCLPITDLTERYPDDAPFAGELIPEHRDVLKEKLRDATLRPIGEILPQFLASQQYSSEIITPWYGRGW